MWATHEISDVLILKRRHMIMFKLFEKCANILAMSDPAYVVCKRYNGITK